MKVLFTIACVGFVSSVLIARMMIRYQEEPFHMDRLGYTAIIFGAVPWAIIIFQEASK